MQNGQLLLQPGAGLFRLFQTLCVPFQQPFQQGQQLAFRQSALQESCQRFLFRILRHQPDPGGVLADGAADAASGAFQLSGALLEPVL